MALKSASDGTERKRIEWIPENKLLCLRRRSRSLEPTPTQLASLPTAPPLIERVYYTAGCWWALNGPASVLPVLASKPSSQAQGLASGAGSHRRCSRSARLRLPLLFSQTEFGFERGTNCTNRSNTMSTFLASAASASSTLMEDEDRHSSGSSYAPKGKLFGPLDKNVSKFSSDRNDGSAQMSAWLVSVDKAMRLNPQMAAGGRFMGPRPCCQC